MLQGENTTGNERKWKRAIQTQKTNIITNVVQFGLYCVYYLGSRKRKGVRE